MGKKYIILLIIILFFPVVVLFLLSIKINLPFGISNKDNKLTSKPNSLVETKYAFVSEIPEYELDQAAVNVNILELTLNKLNLFPLSDKPFIGNTTADVITNKMTPASITVRIKSTNQFYNDDTKNNPQLEDNKLYQINANGLPMYIYILPKQVNNQVEIPVYINTELIGLNPRWTIERMFGYAILSSIFYTFQTPPLDRLTPDPATAFGNFIKEIPPDLLQVKRKPIFFKKWIESTMNFSFIKKTNAATYSCYPTSHSVNCGNLVVNRSCSGGPYPGAACNVNADCHGGTCQSNGATCNPNGTSGTCFNSGGAGGICLYSGCSSCYVDSCTAPTLPPRPTSTSPPRPTNTLPPRPTNTTPPNCTCGEWINDACQAGGCPNGQRLQIRTCVPDGCSNTTQCVADSACLLPTNTPGPPTPTINPTPTPLPPGTFQARARRINPQDINQCSAALDDSRSSPLAASIGFAPSIAPGIQTAQAGNYASWQAAPAVYTISSTITEANGSSYILQTACVARGANPPVSSGLSQNIASGESVTYNLLYTLGAAWSRGQGGDMIACRDISSAIPRRPAPPFFYFIEQGSGGYPGIVSYGGSYDFNGSEQGQGRASVSSTGWLVQETNSSVCDTSMMNFYQFFANKLDIAGIPPLPNPPGVKTKNNFPNEIHLINGDVTLGGAGPWVFGENEKKTIFVNGNVRIQNAITYASNNAFFALIANGNITIEPTVGTNASGSTPSLRGLYVTSPAGRFITGQSANPGREKLIVQGTVIAGGFMLQRDLAAVQRNHDTPAEEFIYDPQLLLAMPEKFKDLKINWEEVAP